MSSTDDDYLVGLTGGLLASDDVDEEDGDDVDEEDGDDVDEEDGDDVDEEDGDKLSQKDTIAALTMIVASRHNFRTFNDTKEVYWYDNELGIYRSNGESLIETIVESIEPNISTYEVNEIINHIKRRTLTPRSEFDSQVEWLTVGNCVVNLKTLETRPHTPEFLATMRIPVSYLNGNGAMSDFYEWIEDSSVACPCPAIISFMHEVMAPEDVETVLDFIAYCLWRGFPFHRYLLFNGSGRNGKGVMLEIIKYFLGHNNVSGESLHRLLETRFATAELYGKLANIDADLSKAALKNTGILKKLTGGDYIPAEKKFRPLFQFVNKTKLLFSANEIPMTEDETDAFFSRLIIINFPNQFLGNKADSNLIHKLTTDEELSGLLRIVLRRLPKVLKEGISTASSCINDNYEKYILSSNPARAFFETALEQNSNKATFKSEVFTSYKIFCNSKKLAGESEQSFNRKLKREFNLEDMQMRDEKGSRPYYWVGIGIKDWKPVEEGQNIL
jgi:putative DNA primase/helicase